jgi:hypothetical protein
MGVDVSSTWTSLQTLPWWAIPAIFVAAMLPTELCMQWWQRRRTKSHQRRWNDYNQRLREYQRHYKEAEAAAYCDWLEWKESLQSQSGTSPNLYLINLKKKEFERAKLAVIGPKPVPPNG